MDTAIFGAGCFWGVEARMRALPGVVDVEVGYCGGAPQGVTYQQVCTGTTGHAEVVKVIFDPAQLSFERLVEAFLTAHDPTQKDRQGPDIGRQYRSVVFPMDATQRATARAVLDAAGASGRWSRPVATTIEEPANYTRAEDYHQQYLAKRGYGAACH